MKIAIVGTRGIPNHYGGFEQFAEFFSVFLAEKEHQVFVYNSHNHPFQGKTFKGVSVLHKNDPEHRIGTAGQFIYDLNCILDARKRDFDIILQLGYTSSSVWYFLLPKRSVIITNMDGLEWKRSKYSKAVRKMLKHAERLAVKSSDHLVADSPAIKEYLGKKYGKAATYIAYGATPFRDPEPEVLKEYNVSAGNFNMIMARMEPENNIEMVLSGAIKAGQETPVLVLGSTDTKYGRYIRNKYKGYSQVRFLGALYNLDHLNNLRYFSNIYFHGHTVGGTNPSLLEAMASKALIAAHDNKFNKGVLGENSFYFSTSDDVADILRNIEKGEHLEKVQNNFESIKHNYNWEKINEQYLRLFEQSLPEHKITK